MHTTSRPVEAQAHQRAPATHPEASTRNSTGSAGTRQPWLLLAVTVAAQILVVLDISVVNTALPSIGRSLGLDGGQLAWLVTAYLMMSGGGLLLGGRIADLLSRRTVFLSGLALFTGASLLSGFASTGDQLIATRALQGLAAAVLTPSALSLITTTYAGGQRKTALAIWSAVGSLGIAVGVLVGGAITTYTGWQFIFWVNGPIGAIALLAGARVIAKDDAKPRPTLRAFDLPGAATVIGALGSLIYGVTTTTTEGWWSPQVVGALAISLILLVVFRKTEERASQPLFPPHVWKLHSLVSGTAVMLGVTAILVGAVFLTSIFLQTVLGFTAMQTGAAFLPFAVAVAVGTVVARHLLGHVAPRLIAAAGLLIAVAASLLLSVASSEAHYAADILPGLVTLGLGVGLVFVPVSVTALAGIPPTHAGVASGFLMTGHEIGAALGVAVLSAVASTAGSLATASGAADAFSRGFVAAASVGAVCAVFAVVRMPKAPIAGSGGHLHLH